jgi:hypothetical protein
LNYCTSKELINFTAMDERLKKLFFLNQKWPIRIWIWSAIACVIFYLAKFTFIAEPVPTELDMILMAYGVGSIAVYVLIFGFDWS